MSDSVLIVLIIAVTILVVLLFFRRQLSNFIFKANREGVEAQLKTHKPEKSVPSGGPAVRPGKRPSVNISGNRQIGKRNKIKVERDDADVSDNLQLGEDQEILARQDDEDKD